MLVSRDSLDDPHVPVCVLVEELAGDDEIVCKLEGFKQVQSCITARERQGIHRLGDSSHANGLAAFYTSLAPTTIPRNGTMGLSRTSAIPRNFEPFKLLEGTD